MKEVKTEIIMEATADLKLEILDELDIEDPTLEEAEAIFTNKSNPKNNL